jgi:hypothetical protein
MMTASNDAAVTGNEDWGQQQSRTVTWHDPAPTVAGGLSMPGIDYLKAMIARELPPPPMARLMQFELVDVEPGKVVFTCEPGAAQHTARRQGIHVHRDQGELFEAGEPGCGPVERHRDGGEVGCASRVHRGRGHRCVGCGRGDRDQHAAGVRPLTPETPKAVAGLSPTTAFSG